MTFRMEVIPNIALIFQQDNFFAFLQNQDTQARHSASVIG